MSNYPPNVSGNEPEIAGYPNCGQLGCGHAEDEHAGDMEPAEGTDILSGCEVPGCGCGGYKQYPQGPDPDELYDKPRDDRGSW